MLAVLISRYSSKPWLDSQKGCPALQIQPVLTWMQVMEGIPHSHIGYLQPHLDSLYVYLSERSHEDLQMNDGQCKGQGLVEVFARSKSHWRLYVSSISIDQATL